MKSEASVGKTSLPQLQVRPSEPVPRADCFIGYGNPLLGDDAAGPCVARRLQDRGIHAIDVHQLTPELAERIAAAARVVFIDCDAALATGEVKLTEIQPSPAGALEHHVTPGSLLRLAEELYGGAPHAMAIGIGPASCELGRPLSPPVAEAVDHVVNAIACGAIQKAQRRPPPIRSAMRSPRP